MSEKMTWSSPVTAVQRFAANDHVSSCWFYEFNLDLKLPQSGYDNDEYGDLYGFNNVNGNMPYTIEEFDRVQLSGQGTYTTGTLNGIENIATNLTQDTNRTTMEADLGTGTIRVQNTDMHWFRQGAMDGQASDTRNSDRLQKVFYIGTGDETIYGGQFGYSHKKSWFGMSISAYEQGVNAGPKNMWYS